jgi:glucan biosynthesis protein
MENSIVSFTPANIVCTGKTASEKRLSVANVAGTVSTMYIAAGKGKAAVAARERLGADSVSRMAKCVADGNYRPLAEALAFTMGESLQIMKLADLDSFIWSTEHAIANLKDEGYSAKTGKPTAKLTMLTTAQQLAVNVVHASKLIVAARVDARNQAKIAAATLHQPVEA